MIASALPDPELRLCGPVVSFINLAHTRALTLSRDATTVIGAEWGSACVSVSVRLMVLFDLAHTRALTLFHDATTVIGTEWGSVSACVSVRLKIKRRRGVHCRTPRRES